jgi:hypothetical protein
MRTGSRAPLLRRNIVLTQRTVDRIATLRERTEAATDTEVMRTALALYDKIVENVLAGSKVQFVEPNGNIRELELLVTHEGNGRVQEFEKQVAHGKEGGL